MKKTILLLFFSLLILSYFDVIFALHSPITLIIDGETRSDEAGPILHEQHLYIPARDFCQSQNAQLFLDASTKTLTISPYQKSSFTVIPLLLEGVTYIKVKDLESLMAISVQWLPQENTLKLDSPYRVENGDALYFENGNWYKGQLSNGKREGFGKMNYVNGTGYEGYFHNHQRHGKGTFTDAKGSLKEALWIQGTLQEGEFIGENAFKWHSGSVYVGTHVNGVFEGDGSLTLPSKAALKGSFSKGLPLGKFTLQWANGTKAFLDFSEHGFSARVYYKNEFLTQKEGHFTSGNKDFSLMIDGLSNLYLEQEAFQKKVDDIFKTALSKYDLNHEYVGIYVEELHTHYRYTLGNELAKDPYNQITAGKFSVASAIKFPLTFAVLKHLEANNLPIESTIYDDLSKKNLSLKQVMKNAVSKSINSNFNYLIRYLGPTRTNEILKAHGALHSRVNGELGGADPLWSLERLKSVYGTYYVSRVTPKDFGTLLRIVYDETLAENPYMSFLNQLLLENVYNARIPRGVGFKYPVAHKTGTYIEMGQFADVGIVYHESNPYIVVILMDRQENTKHCEPFMRRFVKELDLYMSQRSR